LERLRANRSAMAELLIRLTIRANPARSRSVCAGPGGTVSYRRIVDLLLLQYIGMNSPASVS
jgi:hypothetical protein